MVCNPGSPACYGGRAACPAMPFPEAAVAEVELNRKEAKVAKHIIVENKRILCALATLRFKAVAASLIF
jgi:hypothetical protein